MLNKYNSNVVPRKYSITLIRKIPSRSQTHDLSLARVGHYYYFIIIIIIIIIIIKAKGIHFIGHEGPLGTWMQGSTYAKPRH